MAKDIETIVKEEYPEFYDEVQAATAESLNDRLAQLAKDREATNDAKANDEELKAARETAKGLSAPYRDAIKLVGLKSKYIVKLLSDRGSQ